jgi:hypothetical protein
LTLLVAITLTALAGLYNDPDHVLVYLGRSAAAGGLLRRNPYRCYDTRSDHEETTTADWYDTDAISRRGMHPAVRRCLDDAIVQPDQPHSDK